MLQQVKTCEFSIKHDQITCQSKEQIFTLKNISHLSYISVHVKKSYLSNEHSNCSLVFLPKMPLVEVVWVQNRAVWFCDSKCTLKHTKFSQSIPESSFFKNIILNWRHICCFWLVDCLSQLVLYLISNTKPSEKNGKKHNRAICYFW